MNDPSECVDCEGSGKHVFADASGDMDYEPCKTCSGEGRVGCPRDTNEDYPMSQKSEYLTPPSRLTRSQRFKRVMEDDDDGPLLVLKIVACVLLGSIVVTVLCAVAMFVLGTFKLFQLALR